MKKQQGNAKGSGGVNYVSHCIVLSCTAPLTDLYYAPSRARGQWPKWVADFVGWVFWLRNMTEEGVKLEHIHTVWDLRLFTSLGKVFGLLGCCAMSVCSLLPTQLDHDAVPGYE